MVRLPPANLHLKKLIETSLPKFHTKGRVHPTPVEILWKQVKPPLSMTAGRTE